VFDGNKKKKDQPITYLVLAGPRFTDQFDGWYKWGDPQRKCVTVQVRVFDGDGGVIGTREEEECYNVVPTSAVSWQIESELFSALVQTRSAQYSRGDRQLVMSGPGLTNAVPTNVGQIVPGNNRNPGGEWFGTFSQPIEVRYPGEGWSPQYGLMLEVACE